MKQTLLTWYQQKQLTLKETQRLSEITDQNTAYTLAELKLLVQLPPTKGLDKFRQFQPEPHWLKNNWPYLTLVAVLLLIIFTK